MQKLDDVCEQLFTDLDAISEMMLILEEGRLADAVKVLSKFQSKEGEVLARYLLGAEERSAYYEGDK